MTGYEEMVAAGTHEWVEVPRRLVQEMSKHSYPHGPGPEIFSNVIYLADGSFTIGYRMLQPVQKRVSPEVMRTWAPPNPADALI